LEAWSPMSYGERAARMATAPLRHEPSFLIIGGIRCGTTSLIRYLEQHPDVRIPATKEVHYFDWNSHRSTTWYRSWFPLKRPGEHHEVLAGESSPSYLMDPEVPARVARTMPSVRIIMLARNPIERAYSHYRLRKDRGHEPLESFADALADEPRRREQAATRQGRAGATIDCYFHQGEYADGLERWFAHFNRSQILTLHSELLFANPRDAFGTVLDFLGLPGHDIGRYDVHNAAPASSVDPDVRRDIAMRYQEPNARFYELIGEDYGWA